MCRCPQRNVPTRRRSGTRRPSRNKGRIVLIQKLLREPLMHFLALGALVFFLFHLTTDRGDTQDGKIVVTRGTVEQLDRAGEGVAAAELGDTTMLPHQFPLSRVDEIASVFGDEFARRVAQLEGGRWIGPIQSGYGWHIVYVSERTEGRPKPLSEVR